MSKKTIMVFSDASVTPNKTYLGVVSSKLDIKETITIPRALDINRAEQLAFYIANRIARTKTDKPIHYFTDSYTIYKAKRLKYSLHWVPREMNKQADNLANKSAKVVTDIATYIRNKYSYEQRKQLIAKILNTASIEVSSFLKSRKGKQLVKTLLITDLPSSISKKLHSINQLKAKEIERLLRSIK